MSKKKDYINSITLRYVPEPIERINLPETQDQADYLHHLFNEDRFHLKEETIILLLDTDYMPIGFERHSIGTRFESPMDIKRVFTLAMLTNAEYFIVAHNHPNTLVTPSEGDIESAMKMKPWSDFFEMGYLDDIIVGKNEKGENEYYSMAESTFLFNAG